MIRQILILTAILFISQISKSQSDAEFLANELCESFAISDLEKSKEDLIKLSQANSNKIYSQFPNKVNNITKALQYKYTEATNREIAIKVGEKISLIAIDNCEIFQKITQKISLPKLIDEKKSVTKVVREFCNMLETSSNKSDESLNKIVKDSLFSALYKNKDLINKEYGNWLDASYKNDLEISLMNNCDEYYKLIMRNQQ